jgi:hypothetical protein
MKPHIFIGIVFLMILAAGCANVQDDASTTTTTLKDSTMAIEDLILSDVEVSELGLSKDISEEKLSQLGINSGTNCNVDSPSGQYAVCAYLAPSLNDTEVIVQLYSYDNESALNGSYQYNSAHLFGSEGIISKDTYGDQSIFRKNSDDDYGAEFNDPKMHYYHLWFTKDLYMVHVTSSGTVEAEGLVVSIGSTILSKFQ